MIAARTIAVVAVVLSFANVSRAAAAGAVTTAGAAVTTVSINEVESSGGVPGDWVELYNTGGSPVDLSGFVFRDNDDTHTYTLPSGATIAPGGYYLLEEAAFVFGLGGSDSARLFDPFGTLVDSYTWTTAAATTTYGRCPNGTGPFAVTVSVTKGAANSCVIPVTINEIESSGGTPGDWVELYNPDAASADISGFVFRDNDNTHTYTIPVGTTIAPGGYYLLEEAAFGFGLGGADSARLFDPVGAIVDTYTWTTAAATTYGRCPNGTGAFTTTVASTKGAANSCVAPATVFINEVESNGGVPGDWVELYNPGASPADISGFVFRDNDDTHTYTIPVGATIAPGGYYLLEEAAFTFGLGAADSARLFDPLGALADTYTWTAHAATTYGRCPDGTGAFITTVSSTKGAANNCVVPVTVNINEVESSGGVPGDWVELYNPGASPADISGFVFRDNDNTHTYTIPPGATIAAGGYYLLEEAAFGFGLGGADSARLFDPLLGTLVDSYTWTVAAATTYGRCPNGTGAFATTVSVTKGAVNDCGGPAPVSVHINEVESSGGVPGDWIELFNAGASPADLSGWHVLDNDDTHTPYTLPANTSIPAGGYLMVEEAALGFGLGGADAVRLYDSAGALYESFSWATAAATTYGRCPNGTGAFTTTTSVTKGAANDCGSPVKINEVESSGGVPGDWVELYNPGSSSVDLSGYVFRDNDDTHTYTIPPGATIAADSYYLLEEAAFTFGLGGADSARLFDPSGALIDSHTWATAAATTYGRCPNGTGAFTTTTVSTKGAANACPGVISALPWPGDPDVQTVDGLNVFGGNLSGLVYETATSTMPDVLWGVRNGPGSLFRLIFDGAIWTPDPANNWSAGKTLLYPGGTGSPDSEGVTFTGSGPSGGMYVATERDNNANGISRNSILRFDATAAGATLTATHEWNLTADLPVVGPNLGLEAITWIPDTFLVSHAFFDETKGHAYNPVEYANHGTGLFFVGVEANGIIYAYALDQAGGAFARIATIGSSLIGVMDLQFDRDLNGLWAICDDGCLGRSTMLHIDVTGRFVVTQLYDRPGGMPNLNNEGFAFAPQAECVSNRRSAFWADDSETGGHAIRRGNLICDSTPPVISQHPNLTIEATLGGTVVSYVAPTWTDNVDGTGVATCSPASASVFPLGVTTVVCVAQDTAGNIGTSSFTITVQDTIAPQITPPADQLVNQTIPAGAVVNYPPPTIVEAGSGLASSGCLPASGSIFPVGTTQVTCSAADVAGNSAQAVFSVTVIHVNASPVCTAAVPILSSPIFPLDHAMRGVSIGNVSDSDGDLVTVRITGVCQDEAPNAENIPAWAVDGTGVNSSSAAIRAERGGTRLNPGNGRVYHIFFTADDGQGGSCSNEVKVGVALVAGGAAGDGGALFDSVTGAGCTVPAAP